MKCKHAHKLNDYNFCKVACSYCTLQQKDECRIKHKEYFEEEKIKPCPFCGGEATIKDCGNEVYKIECDNDFCIGAHIHYMRKDIKQLTDDWNTRKPIDRIVCVQRLDEEIDTMIDEIHDAFMNSIDEVEKIKLDAQMKILWSIKFRIEDAIDIVKGEAE